MRACVGHCQPPHLEMANLFAVPVASSTSNYSPVCLGSICSMRCPACGDQAVALFHSKLHIQRGCLAQPTALLLNPCCGCNTRTGWLTFLGTSCCCCCVMKTTRLHCHSTWKQCCSFWRCQCQNLHPGKPCSTQQCRTKRPTLPCGPTRSSCCVSFMHHSTRSLHKCLMAIADGSGVNQGEGKHQQEHTQPHLTGFDA